MRGKIIECADELPKEELFVSSRVTFKLADEDREKGIYYANVEKVKRKDKYKEKEKDKYKEKRKRTIVIVLTI